MSSANVQTIVLFGIIAVVLPIALRVVSSPIVLLLLSPLFLFVLAVAFLALHVYFGHYIDAKSPATHPRLFNAARPFAFSTPAAWQAVLTRSQWSQNTPQSFPPLYPESPLVSEALNDIIIKIVRDFVMVWYQEISSSPAFPIAVSTVIHDSVEKMLDRATGIDFAALVVKRILPKITAHIELFRQSEIALRGAGLERRLTQSEELDLLLANRYAAGMDSAKLHDAVDNLSTTFTKQTEEMHLRHLVDMVLPHVLPETEARSKALKIVVREIAACSVLYPVMEMVADPDFWNRVIDQIAGAAIHQQKLITKVRNVLEAQSPRRQHHFSSAPLSSAPNELITIRTDPHQFESFLRSISRFSSLLDARRLKNDVVGEIRRTRMLLANHEKDDWINGEKTEDVVAFLDRLYTAKRKVEERIVVLGGEEDSRQSAYPETGSKSGLTLRDVLRNPSSLSYLMEFMDRRHRSLLVQFWLTVESFKNPLESVDSDTENEEDEAIQDPTTAITVKEDISMIYELYFSSPTPHPALSCISQKNADIIRDFARNEVMPSLASQKRVRRSVMTAQKQVEMEMEQEFEEFERTELWFRVVEDADLSSKKTAVEESPQNQYTSVNHSTNHVPFQSRIGLGHVPPFLQRSESSPGHLIRRTASSDSGSSSRSRPSSPPLRAPPSNIEVLMSPVPDSSENNRAPLFDGPDDQEQKAEEKRMDAIQAALTDIIALEGDAEKSPGVEQHDDISSYRSMHSSTKQKRRAVFDDYDELDEPEDDHHDDTRDEHRSFQLAAPGDLQLSYEISRLGDKITSLLAQDTMLDNLIKKAELTGDTQELRLLMKSKSAMNRELRELQFQKSQYEQQESANRLLSDRTKVSIVSSTNGEEGGKMVVRYLVEVQQLAPDGAFASGWVVARRYNEFLNMHNKLRERYGLVRTLDFPGKLVPALSGHFMDARRTGLEKYLQNVIAIPIVCESDELKSFLSRDSPFVASQTQPSTSKPQTFSGTALVRNVYRTVAESIDDMFFGPSMLDVMIQRLTRQAAEFVGIVGSGVNDEDLVAQALDAAGKSSSEATLSRLSADLKPLDGESSTSTFTAPICDLILAIFELNKQNNWLRRQAIVIILQQVLGGTIERKIRETFKLLVGETRLMSYINTFRDGLWPGGKLKPPGIPRTSEERLRTRDEANRKLSALFPDLAANIMGRSNARRGARRIFAVLQNRRLNQHIAYTVVDEVIAALFPEIIPPPPPPPPPPSTSSDMTL